jgi:hypothetical protein
VADVDRGEGRLHKTERTSKSEAITSLKSLFFPPTDTFHATFHSLPHVFHVAGSIHRLRSDKQLELLNDGGKSLRRLSTRKINSSP